jgi:hypothetical protein
MSLKLNRNIRANTKDIKYLNKDFDAFRQNLIEFAKTYYPNTYSDFNESSPGMMFIEMASFIGDSLSYYIDDSLRESLLPYAQDRTNIFALARFLGYKARVSAPSVVTLSVYQLIPSIGSGENNQPDPSYFLQIKEGMQVESTQNSTIRFVTTDMLDFADPYEREIGVYNINPNTEEPDLYLVKKKIQAISAIEKTYTFDVGTSQPFLSITLPDNNVVGIYDVRDSNNNKYYEVPYLAQDTIYLDYPNTPINDPELAPYRSTVPYILKTLRTPRRFTVSVDDEYRTAINFGVGDPSANDSIITPSFKNVGLGLNNSIDMMGASYDPTAYLKTKSYGVAPANTTITVKYYVGGGIESNVPVGDLVRITGIQFNNDFSILDGELARLASSIQSSVSVDNEVPARGGDGPERIEEIRQNALANFSTQNRAVTKQDYVVRALSMPSKYGSIAKATVFNDGNIENNSPASILASSDNLNQFTDLVYGFVAKPDSQELSKTEIAAELKSYLESKQSKLSENNNPFAVNLYILGYNDKKHLAQLNPAIKQNLKTYISEHRMLTDGVNILDGFIVNIGVDFTISALPNYNKREVLSNCIQEMKEYFNIDFWTFDMPINISEIELVLASVEGVSAVQSVEIRNLCNGVYSPNKYPITSIDENGKRVFHAQIGKIIYPSLDPCVFEVKYPDTDIRGRVV